MLLQMTNLLVGIDESSVTLSWIQFQVLSYTNHHEEIFRILIHKPRNSNTIEMKTQTFN